MSSGLIKYFPCTLNAYWNKLSLKNHHITKKQHKHPQKEYKKLLLLENVNVM